MERNDGTAVAQYFEGSTFIGERRTYCCGASSGGKSFSAYWPCTAYFCPVCGEIWGREILNYQFQYSPSEFILNSTGNWVTETRRCPRHGDGFFLVGKESQLDQCSKSLLAREALLILLHQQGTLS